MQSDRPAEFVPARNFGGTIDLLLTAAPGLAAGGPHFALDGGPKFPSGLTMGIEALGIDANGYRPLRVTVGTVPPNTPLTYDRQVRVVLGLHDFRAQKVAEVSQVIELPEGSSSVTATILVPQKTAWTSLSVKTFEGGEKLDDLSHDWPRLAQYQRLGLDRSSPAPCSSSTPKFPPALIAITRFRPMSPMPSTLPHPRCPTFGRCSVFFQIIKTTRGSRFRGPVASRSRQCRKRIRRGQCVAESDGHGPLNHDRCPLAHRHDLAGRIASSAGSSSANTMSLSISLADLQQLAATQPKQCAALRDWLSTGPLLIVYGAGQRFDKLPQIEKLLQLAPISQDDPPIPELRGWTPAQAEFAIRQCDDAF